MFGEGPGRVGRRCFWRGSVALGARPRCVYQCAVRTPGGGKCRSWRGASLLTGSLRRLVCWSLFGVVCGGRTASKGDGGGRRGKGETPRRCTWQRGVGVRWRALVDGRGLRLSKPCGPPCPCAPDARRVCAVPCCAVRCARFAAAHPVQRCEPPGATIKPRRGCGGRVANRRGRPSRPVCLRAGWPVCNGAACPARASPACAPPHPVLAAPRSQPPPSPPPPCSLGTLAL